MLATDEKTIKRALRILDRQVKAGDALTSPQAVRDYLRLLLAGKDREVFVLICLDAQHRIIASEELFQGTLTQTSVYPREVVKRALANNAAAVMFAHNHPSGLSEPSQADELVTRTLRQALALVDVRTLDHFIVGAGHAMPSHTSTGRTGLLAILSSW